MTFDATIIEDTKKHLRGTIEACVRDLNTAEKECAQLTYQHYLARELSKQAGTMAEREMWELEQAIIQCRIEAASMQIGGIEEELLRSRRLLEIVEAHGQTLPNP
jgi:hypothetical protein